MDGSICQNCQFERDTFWDAQPVEADERWSNVMMMMMMMMMRCQE